jgi:hypothetical protein
MTALLEDLRPATTIPATPAPVSRARRPRRWRLAALVAAVTAVAAAGAAQALLPTIAEQRVAAALGESGEVSSVRVSAFPAVKLLWGSADSVSVRMASYDAPIGGGGGGESGGLAEMRGIDRLDVAIDTLGVGPVTLRDVRLAKDGAAIRARAAVSTAAVREALPAGLSLEPTAGPGGRLELDGAARAFGFDADASAVIVADEGRIVIRPDDPVLASLAAVTVFEDPAVAVTDVRAQQVAGRLAVEARATLR